ncbi:MAG TPA: hypothetical protein DIT07_03985, partial [Sphingobacteriaceae bacterium]|nr:hypothetical protein [Sphingobacteriaceae bacterium]
ELYSEQQELLKAYQAGDKLYLHSLTSENREALAKVNYPSSLSENDKTVLYVASVIKATILSSDKAVRRQAKKQSIEYHGMFWIFDRLVDLSLITKVEAANKLKYMMTSNIIYQGNGELIKEMTSRIANWTKG